MSINRCVVCSSEMSRGNFVRCRSCGLVQAVPMPSVREIASLYHEDFDHFQPYLAQIDVHREYFRKKLQEIKHGKTLLDIGCAMGVLLEEAEKKGFRAQGIDISKDAVAYCRKKGLDVSGKWPEKKLDVITAFQVIEHERDPLQFMKRVYKLLKKNGLVVLATPKNYWLSRKHPEHVTFWSPRSLRFLMEKTGFKTIEIRRDTPRPFPLSFAFTRAADYFPLIAWFLKPIGKLLDRFDIKNPINPWDDMIVFARK